ncbi:MAG: response regulator [Candidatus Omnitrophica bacterium]|nr:response regulator [Candidatus Omnitrophota bacterium]
MAEKKIILMIDNEKEFSSLIKSFLEESCGYEAKIVPDGYNGMRMAAKIKPDLILLDVLMPAMNGFYVLKQLKESKETASIPVMMVTAVQDVEDKLRAESLHCEGYIIKPIKLEDLRLKINNLLTSKGG